MSDAAPEDAGLASGLVNTTQQMGGAIGIAILVSLASERSSSLISGGQSTAVALTSGYRLAFLIAASVVAAAFVLALAMLPSQDPGQEGAAQVPSQEGAGEVEEPAALRGAGEQLTPKSR